MIRGFRKSRIASGLILLVTLAICVAVWVWNGNRPLYATILSTILLWGIGICVSTLVGNIVSARENSRLLTILHVDLDPERFLREYQSVPKHLPEKSYNHAVACSYLADGYAAAGQPEEALRVLSSRTTNRKGEEVLSLQCLYHSNRCKYELQMGDTEAAKQDFALLKKDIAKAVRENPSLAKSMQDYAEWYENWIAFQEKRSVNLNLLTKKTEECQFVIRQLQLRDLLMQVYLRENRKKEAQAEWQLIDKRGGNLPLKEEARKRIEG